MTWTDGATYSYVQETLDNLAGEGDFLHGNVAAGAKTLTGGTHAAETTAQEDDETPAEEKTR